VRHKAWSLAEFCDFLVAGHLGDIHVLTGYLVDQIIDEFNGSSHRRQRAHLPIRAGFWILRRYRSCGRKVDDGRAFGGGIRRLLDLFRVPARPRTAA
jgi:hypothetical protein